MSDDPTGLVAEGSTPGTPLYGILGWRSDSIMLARCRPIFMELIADAMERECEEVGPGVKECRLTLDHRSDWCATCILHDLDDRLRTVAKP